MLRMLTAVLLFLLSGVGLVPEVMAQGPDRGWALCLILALWLGPLTWEGWQKLRQRDPYTRPLPPRIDKAFYALLLGLALATAYLGRANSVPYARYRLEALHYLDSLQQFRQACLNSDPASAQKAFLRCEDQFKVLQTVGARLPPQRQPQSPTWLWDAHDYCPFFLRHMTRFRQQDRFDEDLQRAAQTLGSPLGSADTTSTPNWAHRQTSRWAPEPGTSHL